MSVFKKVIGQNQGEPTRSVPAAPEPRYNETAPVSPQPSYTAQHAAPSHTPSSATRNILSSDVEIKGIVKFSNDLVVDGKIEGEISSDGNLTIGENARIKAEVKTATIIVYGKVHGNLTASDRVELKASAEVVGDIKAKTLSIETGAIFVGKSTVGTPAQAPAQTQSVSTAPASAAAVTKSSSAPEAPKQGTLAGTIS